MTLISGYIEHGRPQFIPAVPDFYPDRFQFASYWNHDHKTTLVVPEGSSVAFTAGMELRALGDMASGASSETSDYLLAPGLENAHILIGPSDELEEPTLEIMRLADIPASGPGGADNY